MYLCYGSYQYLQSSSSFTYLSIGQMFISIKNRLFHHQISFFGQSSFLLLGLSIHSCLIIILISSCGQFSKDCYRRWFLMPSSLLAYQLFIHGLAAHFEGLLVFDSQLTLLKTLLILYKIQQAHPLVSHDLSAATRPQWHWVAFG